MFSLRNKAFEKAVGPFAAAWAKERTVYRKWPKANEVIYILLYTVLALVPAIVLVHSGLESEPLPPIVMTLAKIGVWLFLVSQTVIVAMACVTVVIHAHLYKIFTLPLRYDWGRWDEATIKAFKGFYGTKLYVNPFWFRAFTYLHRPTPIFLLIGLILTNQIAASVVLTLLMVATIVAMYFLRRNAIRNLVEGITPERVALLKQYEAEQDERLAPFGVTRKDIEEWSRDITSKLQFRIADIDTK